MSEQRVFVAVGGGRYVNLDHVEMIGPSPRTSNATIWLADGKVVDTDMSVEDLIGRIHQAAERSRSRAEPAAKPVDGCR